MIQLTSKLWVGSSKDELMVGATRVRCSLNVAQDLKSNWGWPDGMDHMQVGLIDGPGNLLAAYGAAVLALAGLQDRGGTLVFCHTGGRAMAVALMYLNLQAGRTWDDWLGILKERLDAGLPSVHAAHVEAFGRINWKALGKLVAQ